MHAAPEATQRRSPLRNPSKVSHGPSTISAAGVIPGSTTDDLRLGTDHQNRSEPKNRQLPGRARRRTRRTDGYSGVLPR